MDEGRKEEAYRLGKQEEEVMSEEISDYANPEFLFSLTDTNLLVDIVKDKVDAVQLARDELAKRGLSQNGKWAGFGAAREQAETLIWNESFGSFLTIPKR